MFRVLHVSSEAERICALFESYPDAHGTHGEGVANAAKGGKLEIRTTARTVRQKVTPKVWQKHLDGDRPLGLFALRRDSTCMWGAIDVDDYTLSNAEIATRIKREKLPLLVCRTKSGGSHAYVFFERPIAARALMDWLRDAAKLLGVAGSELFPKQDKVLWDEGDFGSWLNMPYLGGDSTERYCVNDKGKGLTLRQFLDAAEKLRVDPDKLPPIASDEEQRAKKRRSRGNEITGGGSEEDWVDGPPCLQQLAAAKFGEGRRNNGLMGVIVYAKKKRPETWQVYVKELCAKYMDPPLTDAEIDETIKSNQSKSYNYKCRDEPLKSICNSALCRTRRFGVGGGGAVGNMPKLANLAVLNTDEPVWFLDVEETRVMFSTADLLGYSGFQQKTMESTRTVPPPMKREDWFKVLQALLETVVVIDAPTEVGMSGQFFEILEGLLTDRQQAQTREELLLGKPWTDDASQRVWFRLRDLQDACERVRFRAMTRTKMIAKIKEVGGQNDFFKLNGRGVNVWSIPMDKLSRQTEPHRTPDLPEEVI